MIVTLVRHGEAAINVTGQSSGLTSTGRMQAEALAARVARSGELSSVTAVYTSQMRRAVETAELVVPSLGIDRGVAPVVDCRFCEVHPGIGEATTNAAPLTDEHGGTIVSPDRDERLSAFGKRVRAAFREVVDRHEGGHVVLFTHGGVIYLSFSYLGGLRLRHPFDLSPGHTSISQWQSTDSAPRTGRWRLLRFNDTSHLEGDG